MHNMTFSLDSVHLSPASGSDKQRGVTYWDSRGDTLVANQRLRWLSPDQSEVGARGHVVTPGSVTGREGDVTCHVLSHFYQVRFAENIPLHF